MLVLSRKKGEMIEIGGGITITVLEIRGNAVKLGIVAPKDVPIQRSELGGEDQQGETESHPAQE